MTSDVVGAIVMIALLTRFDLILVLLFKIVSFFGLTDSK